MTAFISAGHDLKHPGASANGFKEEKEMIEFRNLVVSDYKRMYPNAKLITDGDYENLRDYLRRIQTGNGSVVVEFHLDASSNKNRSGISSWIGYNATRMNKRQALKFSKIGSEILGLKNNGVFLETQSYHKRLGIMREKGIVILVELAFITNSNDMKLFEKHKKTLAFEYAKLIKECDDLIV